VGSLPPSRRRSAGTTPVCVVIFLYRVWNPWRTCGGGGGERRTQRSRVVHYYYYYYYYTVVGIVWYHYNLRKIVSERNAATAAVIFTFVLGYFIYIRLVTRRLKSENCKKKIVSLFCSTQWKFLISPKRKGRQYFECTYHISLFFRWCNMYMRIIFKT